MNLLLQSLKGGSHETNRCLARCRCSGGQHGSLNDLRAILGNDVAIKAYRAGKLPLPDGAMIARVAWSYVPLQEAVKPLAIPNPS